MKKKRRTHTSTDLRCFINGLIVFECVLAYLCPISRGVLRAVSSSVSLSLLVFASMRPQSIRHEYWLFIYCFLIGSRLCTHTYYDFVVWFWLFFSLFHWQFVYIFIKSIVVINIVSILSRAQLMTYFCVIVSWWALTSHKHTHICFSLTNQYNLSLVFFEIHNWKSKLTNFD